MNVIIDKEEERYVTTTADGVSTWGFDAAFEQTELLAERLGRPDLAPYKAEYGTKALLDKHDMLIKIATKSTLGTWFRKRTPDAVKKVIDRLIHSEEVVRVFYGDPETGASWMEEYDTIGTISRASGTLKVPLIISKGERYGGSLMDDRIIRIIRMSDRKNLYCHPGFHVPEMVVVESEHRDYKASVLVNGTVHARFKTYAKACAWVAFMAGDSCEQPR